MASNMEDSRFRRMLTKVVWELKPEEVKALSFTYTSFHFEKGTDMICALINQHIIKDCREDLNYLMESLEDIGRTDLKEIVMKYIKSSRPNQFANDHISSSLHLGAEESNGDMKKSAILDGIKYVTSRLAILAYQC